MKVTFEMAATMPGPPDVVWRLLTDWERQGDWMLEARDFNVVTSEREGVGVEVEATIRIAGINTRDRIRVGAWEPGRRLVIEHLGWVKGRGEIFLGPVGAQTHVLWREVLRPPLGVLGYVGMMLLKPIMAGIFRRDLRVLQALVRASSEPPGGRTRPQGREPSR